MFLRMIRISKFKMPRLEKKPTTKMPLEIQK